MRDFKFIVSKLFKKQFVLLLLVTMVMSLFLINVVNKSSVRASEQLASVKCDVYLIDGQEVDLISTDLHIVSDLDVSEIDFGDVDVKFNASSKIEFVYSIENITNKDCLFGIKLVDNNIQNFKIEYYVDGNLIGDLTSYNHILSTTEIAEIRVVIYVDNVCADANLEGALELSFEGVSNSD